MAWVARDAVGTPVAQRQVLSLSEFTRFPHNAQSTSPWATPRPSFRRQCSPSIGATITELTDASIHRAVPVLSLHGQFHHAESTRSTDLGMMKPLASMNTATCLCSTKLSSESSGSLTFAASKVVFRRVTHRLPAGAEHSFQFRPFAIAAPASLAVKWWLHPLDVTFCACDQESAQQDGEAQSR